MLADEEAGIGVDDTEYAEGEWKENAETGELEWHPAEGGPALTADQWEHAGDAEPRRGRARRAPTADERPPSDATRTPPKRCSRSRIPKRWPRTATPSPAEEAAIHEVSRRSRSRPPRPPSEEEE